MPVNIVVGENSYLDLDEANAYFAERLYNDAWISATDDMKAQALIMATRRIDSLPLRGSKADRDQHLAFPRHMIKPITSQCQPAYPGYVEIKWEMRVKQAVCEESLALLSEEPTRIKLQQQGVEEFQIGKLREKYRPGKIKLLSSEARELMRPYLVGGVSIV